MLKSIFNRLKKIETNENDSKKTISKNNTKIQKKTNVTSTRIGEIGEYKIDIQLDQLPKGYMHLSDLMVENSYAKSGYSQIDHLIISPFAIFVIETKNYTGTIYGDRNRDKWSVNGKYPMMNPFNQNYGHIQAIKGILGNKDDKNYISLVSFNRRCTFKVNLELRKIQSNELIVYDTELSEFINRKINMIKLQSQKELFSMEDINSIYLRLKASNITDPNIRSKHVQALNNQIESKKQVVEEKQDHKCASCGVTVSAKVATFCLENKKRFAGKIFCFEHQKMY